MARAGRRLEGVSLWGMHLGILFAPAILPTVLIIMVGKWFVNRKVKKGLQKLKEGVDNLEVELYGEH